MPLPYNTDWIRNQSIRRQATRWNRQARLTDDQLNAVRTAYPVGFRDTNNAADIGLFLFTLVTLIGALALVLLFDNFTHVHTVSLGFGLVVGGLNEWLLRRQNFYRNGVDNAMILMATGMLSYGLTGLVLDVPLLRDVPYIEWLVLVLAVWRYGDPIMTVLAVLFSYAVLISQWVFLVEISTPAGIRYENLSVRITLVIVWSIGLYAGAIGLTRWFRAHRLADYYADSLTITRWLAIGLILLATNTVGQREIWAALLPGLPGEAASAHGNTSFTGIDALMTFSLPVLFTGYGLWRKDRLFIVLGTLGLVAGVATVRYYVHDWPRSIYLSVLGAVLIGLALIGIRLLRTVRFGFTDAPDDAPDPRFRLDPQTLALIQTTTGLLPDDNSKLRFGGGNFGGGGAGGRVD